MNEAERARQRYAKKYGKPVEVAIAPASSPIGEPTKTAEKKAETPVLLGGHKYVIPSPKKEGLRMVVNVRGLGRDEEYTFFHPNPEAYIPWQDYKRLRDVLRLALNTKLPGIR